VRRLRRSLFALVSLSLCAVVVDAPDARSRSVHHGEFGNRSAVFQMLDLPVGKPQAPSADRPAVTLAGSSIAALAEGALVVDGDSGRLIRTNREGVPVARLDIGPDAPQMAVDRARERAYVVDRRGDQIVVVSLAGGFLRVLREVDTPAEPYGVALTPDGERLLVTAVADRTLVAYRTDSGAELWRTDLAPEPRGVAVSRDGVQVAVAHLNTGAVARGSLRGDRAPRLGMVPLLQRRSNVNQTVHQLPAGTMHPEVAASGSTTDRRGDSYARAALHVSFIGHGITVVPHQISTPHQAEGGENVGGYGGGFTPPISHQLAFLAGPAGKSRVAIAQLPLHQPRATAYDEKRDRLYLFGFGSDSVAVLGDASQASVHLDYQRSLTEAPDCGATGAAVADDGSVLVFCSLTRRVAVLSGDTMTDSKLVVSREIAPSRFTGDQLAGRGLFRKGNDMRMSRAGGMACESCHPEGRTDGLSWRIESKVLQTPLLAGRISGTHPFKWDGGDKDLSHSLTNTVRRLGGNGIGATEVRQLSAFLKALEPPRAPSVRDRRAVARGEKLFQSAEVGCASCHGGKALTDQRKHALSHDIDATDTPSLIGLAGSAPYFHDGSAATLEALLTDRGSVHGMGRTHKLGERQLEDLIAYLETL
jgi:DNA-binding beta-propeller fold protein YncE/mono/diheme cytochrome c family protein